MNGFVFFRLSYFDYSDLQLFAIFIFEVDFSETYFMTSAENSGLGVSQYENLLGEDTDPPTRFVPSALAVMPRVTKNLATSLKGVFFFCQTKNIYALLRCSTNFPVTISFAFPFVSHPNDLSTRGLPVLRPEE